MTTTGTFIYPPFRKPNGPFCGECAGKIIKAFRDAGTLVGVEEEQTDRTECIGCHRPLSRGSHQ